MSAQSITPANRLVYEKKKSVEDRCSRLKKAIQAGGGNSNVAKATGIPKPTLSTYASGRDMKASAAVAIANACGVSLEWLLAGTGPMLNEEMKTQTMKSDEKAFQNNGNTVSEAEKGPDVQERIKRLKFAIQRSGGRDVVAAKSAVSSFALDGYMAGQDITVGALSVIAEACGVSLDWLVRGGEMERTLPRGFSDPVYGAGQYSVDRRLQNHDDTLTIPFFQTEASAGAGIVSGDWEEAEEIHISKGFLRSIFGYTPKNVLLMRARGDSMQPTIQSQDVLIVNYADNDIRPGIYVMAIGDMILVKRLDIKNPQTFEIISDNKEYSSFEASIDSVCWGNAVPDAAVRIIGKVTGHIHLDK